MREARRKARVGSSAKWAPIYLKTLGQRVIAFPDICSLLSSSSMPSSHPDTLLLGLTVSTRVVIVSSTRAASGESDFSVGLLAWMPPLPSLPCRHTPSRRYGVVNHQMFLQPGRGRQPWKAD